MRASLTYVFAAAAVALPGLAAPAFGGQKAMPSAFGKELVPDEETQQRNESKAAETEDAKDREERDVERAAHSAHHGGGHGGKVHIQLDGDEDGGDGDGDVDGGDL
jgi:hypothetical protein